jgi:hypothetical protein
MRIQYKIGLYSLAVYGIIVLFAAAFDNYNASFIPYLLPIFLLIIAVPAFILYFVLTYLFFKSKKLFLCCVVIICLLCIGGLVVHNQNKVTHYQPLSVSTDLSKAKPLVVGNSLTQPIKGRNPSFNFYKVTSPHDGDIRITISADIKASVQYDMLRVFSTNNRRIGESLNPGSTVTVIRGAKSGEEFELVVNQRALYLNQKATTYTLLVEMQEPNILEEGQFLTASISDYTPATTEYKFISSQEGAFDIEVFVYDTKGEYSPDITILDSENKPISVIKKEKTKLTFYAKDKIIFVRIDNNDIKRHGYKTYHLAIYKSKLKN